MSKVRLDLFNNDWYHPGAGILKRTLWYFANVIFFKNGWVPFSGIRIRLLKLFGAKIGKGLVLKPCVNIKSPWLLEIGDHCWIGEEVWIDNLVPIKIANHVCISQGAMLLTGNHNYKDIGFGLLTGEIHLADGVWIGAKSIVCPSITCREGSILTAGSVATHNMDSWGIYQGNPAIFKKTRNLNE